VAQLNTRAHELCSSLAAQAAELGIAQKSSSSGTTVFDFGVNVTGSREAGLRLAEICLAGLATVELVVGEAAIWPGDAVRIETDEPVAACLASQYAGWEIRGEDYFAMGSGPMRAATGREPLFDAIGLRENPGVCVGVLESGRLPPDTVCLEIAAKCGIAADQLTLLVAPTRSIAGTLQIAARSVETALHKLHELKFDVNRVVRGWGTAPLPPTVDEDLAAIGRTNDAILYGGQAVLFVRGDDASLREIGPRVPSSASPDYGRPFAEIFARYDHDFYRVDPLLFSPAQIAFENLDTGNKFQFGQFAPDVLRESFSSGRK
jgi:methenyltetrahydromethanopterin cyclohydrolase